MSEFYQVIADGAESSVNGIFGSIEAAKEKAIEMSEKNGKSYFITKSIAVVKTNVSHTFESIESEVK